MSLLIILTFCFSHWLVIIRTQYRVTPPSTVTNIQTQNITFYILNINIKPQLHLLPQFFPDNLLRPCMCVCRYMLIFTVFLFADGCVTSAYIIKDIHIFLHLPMYCLSRCIIVINIYCDTIVKVPLFVAKWNNYIHST